MGRHRQHLWDPAFSGTEIQDTRRRKLNNCIPRVNDEMVSTNDFSVGFNPIVSHLFTLARDGRVGISGKTRMRSACSGKRSAARAPKNEHFVLSSAAVLVVFLFYER